MLRDRFEPANERRVFRYVVRRVAEEFGDLRDDRAVLVLTTAPEPAGPGFPRAPPSACMKNFICRAYQKAPDFRQAPDPFMR
jgi:hypothetical protein